MHFVGEAAYEFRRLVRLQLREIVIWVAWEKIRNQISFDRGEGTERLEIADAATIA